MSNINLRLYGEQVFGLSSSFLNEYLSPTLDKENFLSMFKNGLLKYENINIKKEITLHPTITINKLLLNSLEVNIPDENDHLNINIEGIKTTLFLSEINEDIYEEMIINQKNNLKEKFIKDLFNKITKKSDSSSILEGMIENIIQKIINGIKVNIKDIELCIKFEKFEFILKINNLDIIIENKELIIDINDLSVIYKNNIDIDTNTTKINVLDKVNLNIKLIINEENEIPCQLKINSKNIKINLRNDLIKDIFDIVNLFRDIKYNKIYYRYKKLIDYHKPIDVKNNYKLLWLYAIKTVIKLRKMAFYKKYDIFELLDFTQKKLIVKNIKENLILINDINILQETKNIVEKKILDSKDSIANKFFSFFSSAKTEEKSLTDEEKKLLEEAYEKNNLEKYIINQKLENDNNNEKEIIKKIKKYLYNFDISVNVDKISIIFNNNDNIYLINTSFYLKYANDKCDFNIISNDIGKNGNESFCKEITNNNNENLIKIEYGKRNLNFMIGKKIEIPENVLFMIICYTNYIIQKILTFKNRSIFHKIKKKLNIKNNNENKLNNKINKISINIPYLPSFTLLTNDNNKIYFEISDYSWTNELISFKIKINDLNNILIDNYKFSIIIDQENKKYKFNMEKPLNINIDKKIIENIIKNYKNINNTIFSENTYINNKLYNFTFTKNIKDINNITLFDNNIDIILNDINFIIKDNENETSIKLKNISFTYENRKLKFNANEISLEFDLLSMLPIIKELNGLKLILLTDNYKYKFDYIKIINEIIKEVNIDINNIKGVFYIEHKIYYINLISNGIKVNNNLNNNEIINFSIDDLNMNWIYIPDKIKIIDSKKINLDIRINPLCNLVFKLNMESLIISVIFLVFNFQVVKEFIKLFFKLKIIYEIKLTNIKTEIFDVYIKNPEDKEKPDLSINLTNYNKIKNDEQIDLLNIEKYNLDYNLNSYTDITFGLKGKKIKIFGSQRDVSFLFFSVLKPIGEEEAENKDNFSELFNSINLDVDLSEIKVDFYPKKQYEDIFFDFFLGNLFVKFNISENKMNNFSFGLDQVQMNYYDYENNVIDANDKVKPKIIPVLNYEIEQKENPLYKKNNNEIEIEKKQLVIKKDKNNKTNISINKINILFRYDIMIAIFYYFSDICVIDLVYNLIRQLKESKNKEIKEEENDSDIQIIFSEIQFQFPINCFNQNNCIYLYFNQFDFNYIKIINNSIKDHRIRISLNNICLKNHKRNIIFSKDEYLLIVLNIKENNNLSIVSNSLFNSLFINLSYKDIIILYKIILDIQQIQHIVIKDNDLNILNNENNNIFKSSNFLYSYSSSINENKIKNIPNIKLKKKTIFDKINSIINEINIEEINITFLEDNIFSYDDNKCFYYPFLNINLYKTKINYESNKIEKEKYPYKKLNLNHNLLINYFNEVNKNWEPLTEDLIIKLDYIYIIENNKLIDNYTLEINKLILNISDDFINILLIKLNNWFYQLNKYYKNINKISQEKNKDLLSDNLILKYIIYNCTDLDLIINCDNKKYNVENNKNLCIEFDDENLHELKNNFCKFIVIEYNKNKIIVFGEEFGIKKFKIKVNDNEREIFIKTKINNNKYVDIIIFNPILVKNNTNYTFQISLNNINNESSKKILILPPKKITSLLNDYSLNKEPGIFNLELISEQNSPPIPLTNQITLNELTSKDINKDILFNNNINLSLISKNVPNSYKKIIISYKYSIVNYLPCSLYINDIEIKKNSLFNLDDISFLIKHNSIILKLKIMGNYFHSKLSLDRNETKKLIKFNCIESKESIILPILIKEVCKTKAIIIYSEYILYNNSGIEMNISTHDENNSNYFYKVGKNIFLISSEIKQSNPLIYFKSNKNIFISHYIQYEQIKNNEMNEFTLNIENKLKTQKYNFDLIINKNISNLWCKNDLNNFLNKYKEEIDIITIFNIIPKYNIINIESKKINIILKSSNKYYMAINIPNEGEIKDISNYYMFDALPLNSIYTICIKETLYNVLVKKANKGGYKNIFIFNNNIKYSQVIVENKTNYDITLKQKKYEKYKQLIQKNKTQILKIYEQTNHIFSIEIDNKLYYFDIDDIGKKQLVNNLYINIEQDKYNNNYKNIIFYIQNPNINLNDDFIQKSKSTMNLPKIMYKNFKINYTPDKYIKINIILNHINISVIGHNNTNKNNKEFEERKEIALIYIDDFQCGIKLSRNIINKNNKHHIYEIKLNTKISYCEIYNLLMNNNIPCLYTNTSSPLINIYSEIIYGKEKNRIKIIELVNKLGDIRLNIAPIFLKEIYHFINKIIQNYKSNISRTDLTTNMDSYTNNKINYTINDPLSIIIDKFDILGIKIRFKLSKEGLDTLPKLIIDFIEYLKCFPFFAIDKETKSILGKISLEGPFKDIPTLFDKLKLMIIAELSKEIMKKVLHPSANEIKDNINNMIGYDKKDNRNNNEDKILRAKYKRVFIGKNKFFRKYDKNRHILLYKIKDELKKWKDKYIIDIFNNEKNIIILFDEMLYYNDDKGGTNIIYRNIKEVKNDKNKINIKYINNQNEENNIVVVLGDKIICEKIFLFLRNFI